jgi:hypothetical protein
MNTSLKLHALLLTAVATTACLHAQGTAFTYQGRLNDNGVPATGSYDLQFAVYDSAGGATVIAGPLSGPGVPVSNGLFTVSLDFGAGVFNGPARWLQIGVRTNGSASGFTALLPRQALTATPYALTAGNLTGTVSAGQLSGTISSNNIGAGSITTTMLAPGAVGSNQLASGAVTTPALADGAVTAAKVATVTNWLMLAITNPAPTFAANFGVSVAAVGSDRVLIGAYQDDTGANSAGAAYLFSANGALLTTFTNPTPASDDWFGYSVATVGNDRVLIGEPRDNTGALDAGAAYLFGTNGALLTTFANPTPAGDFFGHSVAAVGSDQVLIGALRDNTGAASTGAAYLFSTNGTLLTTFTNPTPAAFDIFGGSVAAMGSDRVLIGAYLDDTGALDAGTVYLFSTNGALLTTFTNPTPAAFEQFGVSVAAVGSDRVLIGAHGDGTGANSAGVAYLFGTNGALLTTFTNPTPAASEAFGYSVAAVGSDRVLIGAYNESTGAAFAGAAYLFGTNGALLTTFTKPTPAVDDGFGYSVAAVGSDRVLIGAAGDDTGASAAGAAYLFTLERYAPGLVADGVNAGSINTSGLEDGAVTAAKLDSSIGSWTRSGDNVYRTAGNVGIGTTTPGAKLEIAATGITHQRITDTATGNSLVLQAGSFSNMKVTGYNYSTGTGVPLYLSVDGAHTVLNAGGGSVLIGNAFPSYQLSLSTDSAGKPGGGSWANNSDARIKKNIQPLSGALEKLTQLRGVSFEWINPTDHANQTGRQAGFIAQEVAQVFPNWVQEVSGAEHDAKLTPDGKIKSLSLPFEFDALTVEALRELRAENAELKKSVAELKELVGKLAAQQNGGTP